MQGNHDANFLMMNLAMSKETTPTRRVVEQCREVIYPYFGGGFLIETKKSRQVIGTFHYLVEKNSDGKCFFKLVYIV